MDPQICSSNVELRSLLANIAMALQWLSDRLCRSKAGRSVQSMFGSVPPCVFYVNIARSTSSLDTFETDTWQDTWEKPRLVRFHFLLPFDFIFRKLRLLLNRKKSVHSFLRIQLAHKVGRCRLQLFPKCFGISKSTYLCVVYVLHPFSFVSLFGFTVWFLIISGHNFSLSMSPCL